ncbi:hypothetical protein M0813_22734 [Anaeramoeba flamelloides]|uniref:XRE family transcriptional regulator n=1 Tax=Anaeramoeba flamelloides TaxID=1746091 RepID=A0ABQ8YCJ6_9EUKA|nr:hypothetical protein M0813_22734 [Anaeramoeba flamelloides]
MTTEKQETKEILNVIGKIGNDDFTDEEIKRFYQIFKYYSEDEKGVPLSKLGTTLRLFDQQISNRQTLRFQKQFSSKDLL